MKAIWVVVLLFITNFGFSQAEKVKSAFIYQFTKYIEWCPDYQTGDFVIGIMGSTKVTDELNAIAKSKKVVAQTIVVKSFNSPADITKCNILYIAEDKSGQFQAANSKVGSACTVIITEKSGMAQSGASINFIEADGKVLFEINKNAFNNRGLKLSNQLINLAKASY